MILAAALWVAMQISASTWSSVRAAAYAVLAFVKRGRGKK